MCMGSGSSGGENHGRQPSSMDKFNYFLAADSSSDPRIAEAQKGFLGVTDFIEDRLGSPVPGLNDPRKQTRRDVGSSSGGINATRRRYVEEQDRRSATLGG